MRIPSRFLNRSLVSAAAVAAIGALVWGCGTQGDRLTAPEMRLNPSAPAFALHLTDPAVVAAMRTQTAHTPELLRTPGVVGTAIGADAKGNPALLVLTENELAAGKLPVTI